MIDRRRFLAGTAASAVAAALPPVLAPVAPVRIPEALLVPHLQVKVTADFAAYVEFMEHNMRLVAQVYGLPAHLLDQRWP